jgi:hypothetical protein
VERQIKEEAGHCGVEKIINRQRAVCCFTDPGVLRLYFQHHLLIASDKRPNANFQPSNQW